jgi:capsular polysaccharide biosynthesis protein
MPTQRADQAVDLQHVRVAVRRHRRLVVLATVLGACAGLSLALLNPPPFVGTSLVIFDSPVVSGGSGANRALVVDVDTHAQIVRSDDVLGAAIEETGVLATPASLRERVRASTPTDSLLRIAVSDPDAAVASGLARAVAERHVAFIGDAGAPASDEEQAQLQSRVVELQAQADAVDAELAAARARRSDGDATDAARQAELAAMLTGQRAEIAVELSQLRAQLEAALDRSVSLAGADARVVPDAVSATRQNVVVRGLLLAFAGAVVGLTVGILAAVTLSRRDRTIWSVDHLASVLAAPVVAGIDSHPRRSPAGWRRLLEGYQPPPRDAWAVRRMLRGLSPDGSSGSKVVTLVALDSDLRGQSLGPILAATTASLNRPAALLGLGDPGSASSLWAGLAQLRRSQSARPGLQIVSDTADAEPGALVFALTVIDPTRGTPDVLASSTAIVLCVGAGAVTVDELSRLALSLDAAGHEVSAVVVADPDGWDEPATTVRAVASETGTDTATPRAPRLDVAGGGR